MSDQVKKQPSTLHLSISEPVLQFSHIHKRLVSDLQFLLDNHFHFEDIRYFRRVLALVDSLMAQTGQYRHQETFYQFKRRIDKLEHYMKTNKLLYISLGEQRDKLKACDGRKG